MTELKIMEEYSEWERMTGTSSYLKTCYNTNKIKISKTIIHGI